MKKFKFILSLAFIAGIVAFVAFNLNNKESASVNKFLVKELLADINNDSFKIIKDVKSDDDVSIDCKSIITDLEGVYNKQSLAQYLICQYVYWQRIEKRIDIKQCLMAGGSGCI